MTPTCRRACGGERPVTLRSSTQASGAPKRAVRRPTGLWPAADESVRTWTMAMRGDAAARLAEGDRAGPIRTLRVVLARLDDRPLAYLAPVRAELANLMATTDP